MSVVWDNIPTTVTVTGQSGTVVHSQGTVDIDTGVLGTPTGAAGGDLQGSYPNPTVHRIHGHNMQSGNPSDGEIWYYHNAGSEWQHRSIASAGIASAVHTHVAADVSAAGSSGQVMFNSAGAFAGDPNFTFNATTDVLTIGGVVYTNGETIRDASLMVGPATATRDSVISNTNTTGSRIYYGTPIARSTGGSLVVTANTAYYLPIFIPTLDAIRNIRVVSNGTVTTGNCILGLYSDNGGRPNTRLQQTASTAVSSGFGYTTVAVNWTPPKRGWHWIAAVFSSSPTMYSYDLNTIVAMQGVINFTATGRSCFGEREAVGSYSLPSTATSRILDETQIMVAEVSYTA